MTDTFMDQLLFFILGQITYIIAAIVIILAPVYTRKELLFGVRIPFEATADAKVRGLRRLYMSILSGTAFLLLLIGIGVFLSFPRYAILIAMYEPLLLVLLQFMIFLPCWKEAGNLKRQKEWKTGFIGVSGTTDVTGKGRLREMPVIWYIAAAILCLFAAAYSLYVYPQLPDVIVRHWNIQMEPDAWAPKSVGNVLALPILSFLMVLLMYGSNVVIYFTKLQVSTENPVLSLAQHRMYRRLVSHALGFDTLLISLLFLVLLPATLNRMKPDPIFFTPVILGFSFFMIIAPVCVAVKAGQAGCRLHPMLSDHETEMAKQYSDTGITLRNHINRGDDRFWKLGLFYYNKDDPSLFVEDRFGSNGGLNYARFAAKMIAVILAVLVIATYGFTTFLFLFT